MRKKFQYSKRCSLATLETTEKKLISCSGNFSRSCSETGLCEHNSENVHSCESYASPLL